MYTARHHQPTGHRHQCARGGEALAAERSASGQAAGRLGEQRAVSPENNHGTIFKFQLITDSHIIIITNYPAIQFQLSLSLGING